MRPIRKQDVNFPTLGWHFCMQYLLVCNVTHRYNYDSRNGLSSDVHEESREILDLWKQSESNLFVILASYLPVVLIVQGNT